MGLENCCIMKNEGNEGPWGLLSCCQSHFCSQPGWEFLAWPIVQWLSGSYLWLDPCMRVSGCAILGSSKSSQCQHQWALEIPAKLIDIEWTVHPCKGFLNYMLVHISIFIKKWSTFSLQQQVYGSCCIYAEIWVCDDFHIHLVYAVLSSAWKDCKQAR